MCLWAERPHGEIGTCWRPITRLGASCRRVWLSSLTAHAPNWAPFESAVVFKCNTLLTSPPWKSRNQSLGAGFISLNFLSSRGSPYCCQPRRNDLTQMRWMVVPDLKEPIWFTPQPWWPKHGGALNCLEKSLWWCFLRQCPFFQYNTLSPTSSSIAAPEKSLIWSTGAGVGSRSRCAMSVGLLARQSQVSGPQRWGGRRVLAPQEKQEQPRCLQIAVTQLALLIKHPDLGYC